MRSRSATPGPGWRNRRPCRGLPRRDVPRTRRRQSGERDTRARYFDRDRPRRPRRQRDAGQHLVRPARRAGAASRRHPRRRPASPGRESTAAGDDHRVGAEHELVRRRRRTHALARRSRRTYGSGDSPVQRCLVDGRRRRHEELEARRLQELRAPRRRRREDRDARRNDGRERDASIAVPERPARCAHRARAARSRRRPPRWTFAWRTSVGPASPAPRASRSASRRPHHPRRRSRGGGTSQARAAACAAASSGCSATRCGRSPSPLLTRRPLRADHARTSGPAVIVSAVRTPTGKFLGALKGFTAPELGALVVREAVAPRRHRSGGRRRVHHGQRRLGRPRPEPGAAGGARRRARPTVSPR